MDNFFSVSLAHFLPIFLGLGMREKFLVRCFSLCDILNRTTDLKVIFKTRLQFFEKTFPP